jgi:AcrR family transcriptional regulator
VSKGTLYLYYASKEDLFKAVVRSTLGSLIDEGLQMSAGFAGSSAELLGTLVMTWWQRVGNTPVAGVHKVVMAEARNFPELAQFYADEAIGPAERLFCGAVERGVARGEFRPVPVREVAIALMAPMIFLALHEHSLGACPLHGMEPLDRERVLRTHLDMVLRGLQPDLPGRPWVLPDLSACAGASP